MNRFLRRNWLKWKTDYQPIDNRMYILRKFNIQGMSSDNIRYFINEFCRQYIDPSCQEIYLEVGSYKGCSLLSSAIFNNHLCIGIDNFSQFNALGKNKNILKQNIDKLRDYIRGDVIVYDRDFRFFFEYELKKKIGNYRIKIYFYDGAHDFESQLDGLEMILPFLSYKCIIFVDDVNLKSVRLANKEFLDRYTDFKQVLCIRTPGNCDPKWWNGWAVITRGYDFDSVEVQL